MSSIPDRLRLLRTALTRRFIYTDVVSMAERYGLSIRDVCADVNPFELSDLASGSPVSGPDYSALQESDFTATESYAAGWSSEPSVGRFLGRLVVARQATVVIELGCFVGWSTAHLALALRGHSRPGQVHYLDFNPRYLAAATANLRRLGLEAQGVPHLGLSTDPLIQQALPDKADIIFIDTSHDYSGTLQEISHFGARLKPGGCLVLHDSLSASGVRRAILENRHKFRVATFATERSNGITVLWPK
jgi:predicted O-methyltransferase YrrM